MCDVIVKAKKKKSWKNLCFLTLCIHFFTYFSIEIFIKNISSSLKVYMRIIVLWLSVACKSEITHQLLMCYAHYHHHTITSVIQSNMYKRLVFFHNIKSTCWIPTLVLHNLTVQSKEEVTNRWEKSRGPGAVWQLIPVMGPWWPSNISLMPALL